MEFLVLLKPVDQLSLNWRDFLLERLVKLSYLLLVLFDEGWLEHINAVLSVDFVSVVLEKHLVPS